MNHSFECREKELLDVEVHAILANIVKHRKILGILATIQLGVDIPVKDTKQDDWQGCEHDVVKLNVPFVKDCHCAEPAEVGIKVLWHSQSYILVEEIQDERRYTVVARSTVKENQSP